MNCFTFDFVSGQREVIQKIGWLPSSRRCCPRIDFDVTNQSRKLVTYPASRSDAGVNSVPSPFTFVIDTDGWRLASPVSPAKSAVRFLLVYRVAFGCVSYS